MLQFELPEIIQIELCKQLNHGIALKIDMKQHNLDIVYKYRIEEHIQNLIDLILIMNLIRKKLLSIYIDILEI